MKLGEQLKKLDYTEINQLEEGQWLITETESGKVYVDQYKSHIRDCSLEHIALRLRDGQLENQGHSKLEIPYGDNYMTLPNQVQNIYAISDNISPERPTTSQSLTQIIRILDG